MGNTELLQGMAKTFQYKASLLQRVSFKQNPELLASQAKQAIPCAPKVHLEQLGDLDQHLIPSLMTIGIVVALEFINIHHGKQQRFAITSAALDLFIHQRLELTPVKQTG